MQTRGRSLRGGGPFHIFGRRADHDLQVGTGGREGGKLILHISRNGHGREVPVLLRQGRCSWDGQLTRLVSTGHPTGSWQERETGAGREAGLENERGVPHRHQPLRSVPRTADPVLVHGGDDAQHVPTPEAQLARPCSAVVAESADCPVRLHHAGG